MDVSIWTTGGAHGDCQFVDPKCIWSGEMSCIPRVGEFIEVAEGAEQIRGVVWNAFDNSVEITLATQDVDGFYSEWEP